MSVPKPYKQLPPTVLDFICKLYTMIQKYSQIICFSEDGTEVVIYDQHKLTEKILPLYFRHNNWRSFIRQMNLYNFRKINKANKSITFVNNIFRRGNEANFDKIKRNAHIRAEEADQEKDMENLLQTAIIAECKKLGIPNNQSLWNFGKNSKGGINYAANSKIGGSSIQFPQKTISEVNKMPYSTPHLDHYYKIQHIEQDFNNEPNQYTNSIIHFLINLLKFRQQTQQFLFDLRSNIETIVKQRKNNENKTIAAGIKNEMILIQQINNRLKSEVFTSFLNQNSEKENSQMNEEKQSSQNKNKIQYLESQTKANENNKMKIQNGTRKGTAQMYVNPIKNESNHSLDNNENMYEGNNYIGCNVSSFGSSSSSLNIIVTHPTHEHDRSGLFPRMREFEESKKCIELLRNEPLLDQNKGGKSSFENSINFTTSNNTNNPQPADTNNRLGVSSLCSFSSVTHLLNFDKD